MIVDPRAALLSLAAARGDSLAALSAMLGRNAAYLQQYARRGTPRVLPEQDRRRLAHYFGVDEAMLGGPARARAWRLPRLDVAASAGPGAAVEGEASLGSEEIAPSLARSLGLKEGAGTIIRARGTSMLPGIADGDELVVDDGDRTPPAKGGIYVIRVDDALLVKRVTRTAAGLRATSDNPGGWCGKCGGRGDDGCCARHPGVDPW